MSKRVSKGKLGEMIRGQEVDGRRVEGLRTELPFHISIPTKFDPVTRGKWSPDGYQELISIQSTTIELSGVIDLVVCTSGDEEAPTIRAIDLKTTDANSTDKTSHSGCLLYTSPSPRD